VYPVYFFSIKPVDPCS